MLYSHEPTPSPFLSANDTTRIQQILGTLLYSARAVDPAILAAIKDIAYQQAKPTAATTNHLCQLLDYEASNPNVTIRFGASGMVLHTHSDGSPYLTAPCSRSRAAGYFFLLLAERYNKARSSFPTNQWSSFYVLQNSTQYYGFNSRN